MVSEILKNNLESSKGKIITIYLENGFRHECKVEEMDEECVQIFDIVKKKVKLLWLNQIVEVEL